MWEVVSRAAVIVGCAVIAVPAAALASVLCLILRRMVSSAYALHFSALRDIPEPPCAGGTLAKYAWGHGRWGIMAAARGLRASQVVAQIAAWRRAVGGVFVVRSLFGTPFVVVADTAAVRRIAVAAPRRYRKTSVTRRLLGPIVGERGLIFAEGDDHRDLRKRVAPTMHHAAVAQYAAVFLSEARALRERIAAAARADPAAPIDMQREIGAATCSVIVRNYFPAAVLSSARLQTIKDLYGVIVAGTGKLAYEAVVQQLFPFLPAKWLTKSSIVKHRIRAEANVMLNEASPSGPDEKKPAASGAGSTVLDIMKNGTSGPLTRQQENDNLLTFLLAGQTTTAFAVGHVLWRLARHPEWQQSVRAELDACSTWRDEDVSPAERVDAVCALPVLNRVMKETLRLHPPVAQSARVLAEDDEICGYHLPAGTYVHMSTIFIHMCEDYWQSPEKFDPDRFLPEAEASRDRFAWMPFFFGPRGCIGQQFAMREIAVLVSEVAYAFDLSTDTKVLDPVSHGISTYPAAKVLAKLRKSMKTS